MAAFHSVPPYYYRCLSCHYNFSRVIKWGLYCPRCKSLNVITDFTLKK